MSCYKSKAFLVSWTSAPHLMCDWQASSPSLCVALHLWIAFWTDQNLSVGCNPICLFLLLRAAILRLIQGNHYPDWYHGIFLFDYFYNNTVSGFKLKFLNYFEVILIKRGITIYFHFLCGHLVFSISFVLDPVLSLLCVLGIFNQKSIDCRCMSLFWTLSYSVGKFISLYGLITYFEIL